VQQPLWTRFPVWTASIAFSAAVLVFYWTPLTDPNAIPQWDTIDYHYSVQKFAGEELTALRLPLWTEFSYSGFPFLADPQVGFWYPLNWPFFLAGITPKALQAEIALHVLLACLGCWLLARLWTGGAWYAAMAAVLYAFSGFFAGHASHLGMLQTASWLPILLFGMHVSMRKLNRRAISLTGAGCACMFLAGHFQSALYSFGAIGIYALTVAALEKRWLPAARVLGVCAVITVLLSAVQWLPTVELVGQSTRANVTFTAQTNAPLETRALWTLLSPNHYGSLSGVYTGPEDRTQFYFYAGFVLLPLAALGLASGRLRWAALALIVPFGWYAFGPSARLYTLVAALPGVGSVRAPVHAWFAVALGLALLAAAGLAYLCRRVRFRWLAPAIVLFAFCDVFYWNLIANHLAFFRGGFEQRYGQFQDNFERTVKRVLPAGARFHSPMNSSSFGPLNHAYDLRLPVTYGSNPLPLRRYQDYFHAAGSNRNLLDALHVGAIMTPETGAVNANPGMLPKFWFPKRIVPSITGQAIARLPTANPAAEAILEGESGGLNQDAAAVVSEESGGAERYVLHCETKTASLLRAAIPWYPAWRATIDGRETPVRIVDHAMVGIPVPGGRHRVVLEYDASRFRTGGIISLAALGLLAAAFVRRGQDGSGSSSSATT
jgi:hypothetical protein